MRIQRLALNAAIACACTALGCAGATSGDMVPVAQPAPALTSSSARPGDVVRLRVWREPDLTGDFVVEETGLVVLPRLGPVDATAETAESLRKRVSAAFAEFLP
ncbi:MAG TPA: polysaccharide biosynthesis/export family protein, partial [Longimicrobiales bacterium]